MKDINTTKMAMHPKGDVPIVPNEFFVIACKDESGAYKYVHAMDDSAYVLREQEDRHLKGILHLDHRRALETLSYIRSYWKYINHDEGEIFAYNAYTGEVL